MTSHTIADMRGADTDSRVYFRRPNDCIYAILGLTHLRHLKRTRQLDDFLQEQRKSGIVIVVAGE